MKKIFTLVAICLAVLFSFDSCKEDEPITPVAPDAPAALTVSDITEVSAILKWSGEATTYEVSINNADAITVTGKTHTATGLTAETDYTWKVRAVEGELYSDWVAGDKFTTEATDSIDPVAPDAPTDLALSVVTHESAVLTWKGTTASYQIEIGGKTQTVGTNVVTVNNLNAETEYTWRVRAVEDELFSDWVDGPAFTTEPLPAIGPLELSYVLGAEYNADWFDEAAGQDTGNFWLALTTYDPAGADLSGWYISLDLCTFSIIEWPDMEFYDIPAGYYPISTTVSPDTCIIGEEGEDNFTRIEEVMNGEYINPMTLRIIGGGVIIIGNSLMGYTITATLELSDGRTIEASYNGPIEIPVPPTLPELGEFVDGMAMAFEKGNTSINLYDDQYEETGIGYELSLDLYYPADLEEVIPDGTYTIGATDDWRLDNSYATLGFHSESGISHDFLESGSVTTHKTGTDTYNIEIDLTTESGRAIQRTYSGYIQTFIYYDAPPVKSFKKHIYNYSSKFSR